MRFHKYKTYLFLFIPRASNHKLFYRFPSPNSKASSSSPTSMFPPISIYRFTSPRQPQVLWPHFSCQFQRRLFDDTREAEKVLHFLETRNVGQIVQLTIVPLFHSAITRIKGESKAFAAIIPSYDETMEKLSTMCCRLSREAWISHTPSVKGMACIDIIPISKWFTFAPCNRQLQTKMGVYADWVDWHGVYGG